MGGMGGWDCTRGHLKNGPLSLTHEPRKEVQGSGGLGGGLLILLRPSVSVSPYGSKGLRVGVGIGQERGLGLVCYHYPIPSPTSTHSPVPTAYP